MGGSVKAPAPDPALQEARIESLNTQADLGRRQLAAAEDLAPIQMEQMKFGLEAAHEAYGQTQQDREYALGKRGQYDKAVDAIITEGDKFDEATRRQELMQQAKADISQQFSAAQEQQTRGLNRAGVMPGSGKALLAQQQGELAEAAAKSRAGLMVSEAAKKEGLALKGQTAQMLAGYPAAAASLAPSGANLGVMGLDVANRAGGGINEGFGASAKLASNYGNMAGDMYSNQQGLYQSAQDFNAKSKNEAIGTGVGVAGGAAYKGQQNYSYNGDVFNGSRTGTDKKLGWGWGA
jgi:hypothetical protein